MHATWKPPILVMLTDARSIEGKPVQYDPESFDGNVNYGPS